MVKKLPTCVTGINADMFFLKKACEFRDAATLMMDAKLWNAASILCVHSVICGGDALCAHFLKRRYSGNEHLAAINLWSELDFKEIKDKTKQAKRVITQKNKAEYSDKLISENTALTMYKDTQRLLGWIQSKMS